LYFIVETLGFSGRLTPLWRLRSVAARTAIIADADRADRNPAATAAVGAARIKGAQPAAPCIARGGIVYHSAFASA